MSYKKLIQTYRESDNLVDWLQKLVGAVAEVENWIEVTAQGSGGYVDFENSWSNYGSGYHNVGFYKDPFGVVRLRGWVTGGVSTATAFTLPTGYYDSGGAMEFIVSNDGGGPGPGGSTCYVEISAGGLVKPTFSSGSHIALDDISFRV